MADTKKENGRELAAEALQEAIDNYLDCNCSYDVGTAPEDRCDGTCTYSKAKRAVALLESEQARDTKLRDLLAWAYERLVEEEERRGWPGDEPGWSKRQEIRALLEPARGGQ